MKNIPNIPFDDLGKVGKKVFYCVHKNLKLPTEELNQWQKKKKKKKEKKKKTATTNKKTKRRKRKKGKGLFSNRYFQTSLWR